MARAIPAIVCGLLIALPPGSHAEQSMHPDGFWKLHPARHVNAEFGGEDPIGLSAHQHIPTDCSIAWKDQLRDKVYCFSSPISSLTFQDEPSSILPKAAAFWNAEHPSEPDLLAGARPLD